MMKNFYPTYLQCPKITNEDIFRLENQIGFSLPDDYRYFLLEFNGGACEERYLFRFQDDAAIGRHGCESDVDVLFGIKHSDTCYHLELEWELVYRDRMPNGFLPIGTDAFGNCICLCLNNSNYGKIYFWDHELETEPPTMENCFFIANSFTEFLESLYTKSIYNE